MHYPLLPRPILGGSFNPNQSYLIVGAGISGLFMGYYLKKQGVSFKIIEKNSRAGGLLQTHALEHGIAEAAANAFVNCYELEQLLGDIKLPSIATNKESRNRYIYNTTGLEKLPVSISNVFSALHSVLIPHSEKPNTVAEFGNTFINNSFTENIISPGLSGVYAAYAHELGFQTVFPSAAEHLNSSNWFPGLIFKKTEKRRKYKNHGSRSFEGGMGLFVNAIAEYLEEEIVYNEQSSKYINQYDNIIICTPAFSVKEVIDDATVNQLLNNVIYSPIVSATFILKKEQLKNLRPGFGCLIPEKQGYNTLGILFNNYIFPKRVTMADLVSITCIVRNVDLTVLSKDEMLYKVFAEAKMLLDIKGEPIESIGFQYVKGIPLYNQELSAIWIELDQYLKNKQPHIHLFGNYTGRISIRGMCQAASQWTIA